MSSWECPGCGAIAFFGTAEPDRCPFCATENSSELWDEYGTPKQEHVACAKCGESDEVGSHFDKAWCCRCGWSGSLTEMRRMVLQRRADRIAKEGAA